MKTYEFKDYLQKQFPDVKFYSNFIDKNEDKCIGIYAKDNIAPIIALGGMENTSYGILPLRILVHWTKSTVECEDQAYLIYKYLLGLSDENNIRVVQILDANPIYIGRSENDICEMVIRINVIYEREVI